MLSLKALFSVQSLPDRSRTLRASSSQKTRRNLIFPIFKQVTWTLGSTH
jgi:hypothetical protein